MPVGRVELDDVGRGALPEVHVARDGIAVELGLERLGFERLGLLLYDAQEGLMLGTYGTDPQGRVVAEHHLCFASSSFTGILQRTLAGTEHFAFDENAQLFSDFKPIGFGWNAASGLWNGQASLGCLAITSRCCSRPGPQVRSASRLPSHPDLGPAENQGSRRGSLARPRTGTQRSRSTRRCATRHHD